MALVFPDGQPFDEGSILSGDVPDYPVMESAETQGYLLTLEDPEAVAQAWGPMACPPPTKWSKVSARTVRGSTFYPVSPIYGPSQVDETITLRSDRTVTKGVIISAGIGLSVGPLEVQTGVKLDGSVTNTVGETRKFYLQRGMRVYLAMQIIYTEATLQRTTYAGPNCRPSTETGSVLTPINKGHLDRSCTRLTLATRISRQRP